MTQPVAKPMPLDDLAPVDVEEAYRRLLRLLRAGRGMFTLIPVESTLSRDERDALFGRLRNDLANEGLQLRELEFSYGDWEPLEVLDSVLGDDGGDTNVVLIHGL